MPVNVDFGSSDTFTNDMVMAEPRSKKELADLRAKDLLSKLYLFESEEVQPNLLLRWSTSHDVRQSVESTTDRNTTQGITGTEVGPRVHLESPGPEYRFTTPGLNFECCDDTAVHETAAKLADMEMDSPGNEDDHHDASVSNIHHCKSMTTTDRVIQPEAEVEVICISSKSENNPADPPTPAAKHAPAISKRVRKPARGLREVDFYSNGDYMDSDDDDDKIDVVEVPATFSKLLQRFRREETLKSDKAMAQSVPAILPIAAFRRATTQYPDVPFISEQEPQDDDDEPEPPIPNEKILKHLRKAVSALKIMEESVGVLEWIRKNYETREDIVEFGQYCEAIAAILRPRGKKQASSVGTASEEVEPFYIYRNPKFVMFLKPVEKFEVKARNALVTKTMAFACEEGKDDTPTMWAISGWADKMAPHPKLLDNVFWTKEVFNLARSLGYVFRSSGYDQHNGNEVGIDFASHSENQAVLWSACDLVRKHFGYKSVRDQIEHLPKLQGLLSPPAIRIFLGEDPCKPCKDFKALVEAHTGIKIEFTSLRKKLAEVKSITSANGMKRYPRFTGEPLPWCRYTESHSTVGQEYSYQRYHQSEYSTGSQTTPQKRTCEDSDDGSVGSEYCPSEYAPRKNPQTPRRKRAAGLLTPVNSPRIRYS